MNAPTLRAAPLAPGSPFSGLLQTAVARLAAAGCEEARLDAELLLAAACGQSRAWLLAHRADAPDDGQARRFEAYVERRALHEPVTYILGHKEFYGLDLLVDRRVLIPRPETETLVETALEWLQHAAGEAGPLMARADTPGSDPAATPAAALTVVDVGTGSGAIALALAAHTPTSVHLFATDVSPDALAIARANAARLGHAERITFFHGDLLSAGDLSADQDAQGLKSCAVQCGQQWASDQDAQGLKSCAVQCRQQWAADLIVANLPYVARDEWATLAPDISAYEPRLALDGGPDGLDLYRRLLAQAPSKLSAKGALLLEIGWQQAAAVRALVQAAFPAARVQIIQDLAGQDRVAQIEL